LLVFGNTVFADVYLALQSGAWRRMPFRPLLLLIVLLLFNAGYGQYRLSQDLEGRDVQIEAAVIQGNVDQAIKWEPAQKEKTVAIYRDLSQQAHQSGAGDLLIWPEAATPFHFQNGGRLAALVRDVPRTTGAHLLFGSPAYKGEAGDYQSLNSAFLLSPDGGLLGRSDKVHLVPFGEYVPLKPLLPFIDKLVVGIGDFSPGRVEPLSLNGHSLGVLVCYEAIFPELARAYVRSGSDLLVNITNDAWFGRSSAPAQHLAMVRFRAIENRVWIARAANTGISAFISPAGRIIASTELFKTTYLTARIGLGARPGLYARMGDLLPGAFLLLSLIWLVQTWQRRGLGTGG
jgi:apolipoprotein N-acyltransferase